MAIRLLLDITSLPTLVDEFLSELVKYLLNPILHGLSSMQFHMAHGYHNHPLRLRPVKVKKCKH